jgi:DNA-binding MarR family transcriptional regulator
MQVSPAGASQMIERLVQSGLVQRIGSRDDRRVRQVHLTEQGRQVVLTSISARQQWVESLIARLPEEQKEAIGKALRVLIDRAAELE